MSLLAMIDYSLVIIFFICITGLLLLSTRSHQHGAASTITPSLREAPTAYLFLAALFIMLIILTALVQRGREQSNVFG